MASGPIAGLSVGGPAALADAIAARLGGGGGDAAAIRAAVEEANALAREVIEDFAEGLSARLTELLQEHQDDLATAFKADFDSGEAGRG